MSDMVHSRSDIDSDHTHHDHTHGAVDPALLSTERGIWAIKWSLSAWAPRPFFKWSSSCFQEVWRYLPTRFTTLPTQRRPFRYGLRLHWGGTRFSRFTYGFGRVEDLAGVTIVLTILFSALVAGYVSINAFSSTHCRAFMGRGDCIDDWFPWQ